MCKKFNHLAQQLDTNTPPDRNRYADFLRVIAILVVVLGHWLMAVIKVDHGQFQTARLISIVPETQWLTWIFQVMPLFFFVGGLANAISWEAARRRNESYVHWVQKRARRLLWPLIPLIALWLPTLILMDYLFTPTYLVLVTGHVVMLPVWFLAAYFTIVALAPAAYFLHKRWGLAIILFCALMAIAVDVLVAAGVEWVGWSNFFWVWGAIHQAGFFWHDERLPQRPLYGILGCLTAYTLLFGLTQFGDYPISMIGTGADTPSNNSPPTFALMVLACGQIGVLFALQKIITPILHRPRIWALIMVPGSRLMTTFLWHMAALVLISFALVWTGIWPVQQRIDALWWLLRIPWLSILTIVLIPMVLFFGRFENSRQPPPRGSETHHELAVAITIVGAILTVLGLTLLIDGGLYAGGGLKGIAWMPLALFLAGLLGLRVLGLWIFSKSS